MPCSNLRRRRARLATLCILCALALRSSGRAQASAPALPSDLSTYVEASMKAFSVPGLALAIVKDGKIIVAKGYGVRKLGESHGGRRTHHVRHRVEHESVYHRCPGDAGGCGQALVGRSVYQRLPGFVMYDPYVSHEMTYPRSSNPL